VLPLLLLLVLGTIEAGRLLAIFSSMSSAAKQAARYGAVAGDRDATTSGEQPFYQDCQGIRTTVRRTALFVGLSDSEIDIHYDRGTGTLTQTVAICAAGALSPTITLSSTTGLQDGDRLVVSLSTTYRPIVPLVPIPDIPFTFSAARTILTSIVGPTNTPRPDPDLRVAKVDSPDPVFPGNALTYVITVTNSAGSTANDIVVTDTMPIEVTNVIDIDNSAFDWNCTQIAGSPIQVVCRRLAGLKVNQSASLQLIVTAPITSGLSITNTATVTSARGDINWLDNTTTARTLIIAGADLEPFKLAEPSPVVGAGTLLTYTVYLRNNGGQTALATNTNRIVLTDTLPAGVILKSYSGGSDWDSCNPLGGFMIRCTRRSDIPAGVTIGPLTIVVTAPTTAGDIVNSVTAASVLTVDPLSYNDIGTLTTTVSTDADLALTKVSNPAPPTPIDGGSSFSYLMRVTNGGPSIATNVVLTDTLPTGVTLNSITGTNWNCAPTSGPGVTVTCTYAITLTPGQTTSDLSFFASAPVTGALYTNAAAVTASQPDPNQGNNSATADTLVVDCDRTVADAGASTITASPTQVLADGTSYADVLVELKDNCTNHALVTTSQTVTLSPSPTNQQIINVLGGSGNTGTTTTGQITFRVSSTLADSTTTYSGVSNGVNLADTASVDYYGCITGALGFPVGNAPHGFVQFIYSNNQSYARQLTNLSLSWPQSGSRKITSVALDTPNIWTGNSNANPFNVPSTSPTENFSGTSADRTINPAQSKLMTLNFNFNVVGSTFTLQTTWDDGGGGRVCTNSLTYVK